MSVSCWANASGLTVSAVPSAWVIAMPPETSAESMTVMSTPPSPAPVTGLKSGFPDLRYKSKIAASVTVMSSPLSQCQVRTAEFAT